MKVLRTPGIIEGSKRDLIPFISHFWWIFGFLDLEIVDRMFGFFARFRRIFSDFAHSVRRFLE